MRKRFFRFLKVGLVCLPVWLNAQDEPKPEREEDHSSFVAVRFGTGIAGKGMNEGEIWSPQVVGGLNLAVEGAWLPHRNIGLMLSAQNHHFTQAVLSPFSEPGYIAGQTRKPWNTRMILGGLYLSKPFVNWDLEGRFLAGYGATKAFAKFYERQNSPAYEARYSFNAASVWYQTGITARIDKQKGWSVALHYDLSFTQFPIKETGTYSGDITGTTTSIITKSIRLSAISFSVLYSIPHYK